MGKVGVGVVVGWTVVARISVPHKDEPTIEINEEGLQQASVDREAVRAAVRGAGSRGDNIRWTECL